MDAHTTSYKESLIIKMSVFCNLLNIQCSFNTNPVRSQSTNSTIYVEE